MYGSGFQSLLSRPGQKKQILTLNARGHTLHCKTVWSTGQGNGAGSRDLRSSPGCGTDQLCDFEEVTPCSVPLFPLPSFVCPAYKPVSCLGLGLRLAVYVHDGALLSAWPSGRHGDGSNHNNPPEEQWLSTELHWNGSSWHIWFLLLLSPPGKWSCFHPGREMNTSRVFSVIIPFEIWKLFH